MTCARQIELSPGILEILLQLVINMNDPCKECNHDCCNDFNLYDIDRNKLPTCKMYLNHPQLKDIRVVLKPNGKYRCMEYNYKTGLCTIYRNRPYICFVYRCSRLKEWFKEMLK